MTVRRIVSCILGIFVMTACGQSVTPTPTATPSPASTSTLPVTFGLFLTPTPDEPFSLQGTTTASAEKRDDDIEPDEDDPTRTPTVAPTPTPTFVPAVAEVNFDVDLPYLQDGGALPPGAVGRIGIGYIRGASLVNDYEDILLHTSTGIYTYQFDTFERVWRKYLTWNSWGAVTSPNRDRVVFSHGWEAAPVMYDTEDGSRVAVLDGWYGAYWSPDGTKVAVEERPSYSPIGSDIASFMGRINLYNGFDGEHLRTLEVELPGFYGSVFRYIIWSPDSTYIAACTDLCSNIHIWNALDAELLHTISANTATSGEETLFFYEFGFSPDGKYLVASDYSHLMIFDLNSGDSVLNEEGGFSNIKFFGENILFINDGELTILDLNTLEDVNTVDIPIVDIVAVSPDEEHAAVASRGNDIIVLDLPSLDIKYRIPLDIDYAYWSPGGNWLIGYASNRQTSAYVLIDVNSGQPQFPLLAPSDMLRFLDDETLVIADDSMMYLIDMESGAVTDGYQYGIDVERMGWSPDGQLLLVDQNGKLWAWMENTGEVVPAEIGQTPPDMSGTVEIFDWMVNEVEAESPDGRLLARAFDGGACGDGPFGGGCAIWSSEFILIDQDTEESVIAFTNDGTGISAFGWSSDGSMLAMGEGGGGEGSLSNYEIIIIDPETGDELFRFEGHLNDVNKLIFSPDGSRLASASSDGTVIIWNTAR